MVIKLYVEGGGEVALLNTQCRRGFQTFFKAAGLKNRMPRIIASGSRQSAFDNFRTALKEARKDDLPLLLVDSEASVDDGVTVWEHLKKHDNLNRSAGASDDQAFLMVQCMETWFLADLDSLARFFGKDFNSNAIPRWKSLESVDKIRVFSALTSATKRCRNKSYQKGRVSFELLERIDPNKVVTASNHARTLLNRLRGR